MIIAEITLVIGYLKIIITSTFSSTVKDYVTKFPNLICSISSPEPLLVLATYCLFAIVSFKLLLILFPTEFVNMNHEKMGKITIFIIIICWITEYTVIIFYFETICNTVNIDWLRDRVTVKDVVMKQKPAILTYHMFMVWIPYVLKLIIQMKKMMKKLKNKVLPAKCTNQSHKVDIERTVGSGENNKVPEQNLELTDVEHISENVTTISDVIEENMNTASLASIPDMNNKSPPVIPKDSSENQPVILMAHKLKTPCMILMAILIFLVLRDIIISCKVNIPKMIWNGYLIFHVFLPYWVVRNEEIFSFVKRRITII